MNQMLNTLVLIRDRETRSAAKAALEGAGHSVVECDEYSQARVLFGRGFAPDLVLLESPSTGLSQALRSLGSLSSSFKDRICVITGTHQEALRKEASKEGVRRFLMKPVTVCAIESMITESRETRVQQASGTIRSIEAEPAHLATTKSTDSLRVPYIEELGEGRFFLAASPRMLEIHRQVKRLASVDVNVLITGESGTGKEVIAHLIHKNSKRSRSKFLSVNCAALPGGLLESEMFGHRQGAFTGAVKDHPGKFEQADGGTLLLDEIGEVSTQMQAKLLQVLQDGQFTRLGARETSQVDVRVLAATNVEMERALLEKSFREDLYYRLSVFTVSVPPLRERREEIPYLIEEMIRRTSAKTYSSRKFIFSSQLMEAALRCEWRGNLRELRNFVVRTIVMQDTDAAIRELEAKSLSTGMGIQAQACQSPAYGPMDFRATLKCG